MSDMEHEKLKVDRWRLKCIEEIHRFSIVLAQLQRENPSPENGVLGEAMNFLATELWDRGFSLSEIRSAMSDAAADVSRYAAGEERRQ